MEKKSNAVFISIVLLLIAGVGITVLQQKQLISKEAQPNSGLQEKRITIGNTTLQVEIAKTPKQQQIGLSHRKQLKEGRGMLFTFNTDHSHPIWMKDMQFPIDIVWIDNTMKVVHIEQMVAPETFPQSFQSPTLARYVLEVPAGYTNGNIDIHDTLLLKEE